MKKLRSLAAGALASILAAGLVPAAPTVADSLSPCLGAARANQSASSYRAIMTTSLGVSTIDIVKPDRFHMTAPHMEMVAIGSKMWLKTGSTWRSMPGFPVGDLLSAVKDFHFKNQGASCVDAGLGTWHGVPAHMFKGTSDVRGKSVQATMYVFPDGYVHHIEITGSGAITSMDFTNFNSASVNPPV